MADDAGLVQINPGRLTLARELRVMSKTDLAHNAGVNIGTVVAWERTGMIRSTNFQAVCEVLRLPKSFFLKQEPVQARGVSNFRLLQANTAQKWRQQAEGYGVLVGEFLQVLDASVGLPDVKVPSIHLPYDASDDDVIVAARKVRETLNAATDPIVHATRKVESLGVAVAFTPLGFSRGVDAYSLWHQTRPIIIQATSRAPRLRFDLWHEFGHLVMHRTPLPETDDDLERVRRHKARELQAHLFAGEMLLPTSGTGMQELERALVGKYWTRLIEMKLRWGTSLQFLLQRGRASGIIDEETYNARWQDLVKRGWRKDEPPKDQIPELPAMISSLYAELKREYPDADERLHRMHGFSAEFVRQFSARSPSSSGDEAVDKV